MLATGLVHIEQFSVDDYSTVPTIGTLFLLNFIGAIVITVGLIAPIGRVAGRYTDAFRAVMAELHAIHDDLDHFDERLSRVERLVRPDAD